MNDMTTPKLLRRRIRSAPAVLIEVENLLHIWGPLTIAELMDRQVEALRRHGRPGRLFDKAWMQSAVTDLIRLGAAREWPHRRKGREFMTTTMPWAATRSCPRFMPATSTRRCVSQTRIAASATPSARSTRRDPPPLSSPDLPLPRPEAPPELRHAAQAPHSRPASRSLPTVGSERAYVTPTPRR